jgi:hypothetical protein
MKAALIALVVGGLVAAVPGVCQPGEIAGDQHDAPYPPS